MTPARQFWAWLVLLLGVGALLANRAVVADRQLFAHIPARQLNAALPAVRWAEQALHAGAQSVRWPGGSPAHKRLFAWNALSDAFAHEGSDATSRVYAKALRAFSEGVLPCVFIVGDEAHVGIGELSRLLRSIERHVGPSYATHIAAAEGALTAQTRAFLSTNWPNVTVQVGPLGEALYSSLSNATSCSHALVLRSSNAIVRDIGLQRLAVALRVVAPEGGTVQLRPGANLGVYRELVISGDPWTFPSDSAAASTLVLFDPGAATLSSTAANELEAMAFTHPLSLDGIIIERTRLISLLGEGARAAADPANLMLAIERAVPSQRSQWHIMQTSSSVVRLPPAGSAKRAECAEMVLSDRPSKWLLTDKDICISSAM